MDFDNKLSRRFDGRNISRIDRIPVIDGHLGHSGMRDLFLGYSDFQRRPPSNAGENSPYLDIEAAALAQLPQAGFHFNLDSLPVRISWECNPQVDRPPQRPRAKWFGHDWKVARATEAANDEAKRRARLSCCWLSCRWPPEFVGPLSGCQNATPSNGSIDALCHQADQSLQS